MLARVVVLVGMVAAGSAWAQTQAAEQWLCVTDQATGFNYDPASKSWRGTTYKPDDLKYILRQPKTGETTPRPAAWVLSRFGEARPSDFCASDFRATTLICPDLSTLLVFNRTTLHFTRTRTGDYFWGEFDANPNMRGSPAVEIGRCTPL